MAQVTRDTRWSQVRHVVAGGVSLFRPDMTIPGNVGVDIGNAWRAIGFTATPTCQQPTVKVPPHVSVLFF